MPFKRPLLLVLVLFGALFAFREPLRDLGRNALISTSTDPSFGLGAATSTNGTSTGTGSNPAIEKAKPVSGISSSNKGILTPLDKTIRVEDSALSINGIVSFTNKERTTRQFPALRSNQALNASAQKKLEDMFDKQYFEHESPNGVSVADLVSDQEYQYIAVGENLALGNFGGDQQVVTAWMNSPGHRANILDPRFQEIGIAVGKGLYKGRQQWIAVQHFAKPLSSCPGPSGELKEKINAHAADLTVREKALSVLKKEIDEYPTNDAAYIEKVERYNDLVGEYNVQLESLKSEISAYNEQVRAFNSCAGLSGVEVEKIQAIAQAE